jgi:hypothetical protein
LSYLSIILFCFRLRGDATAGQHLGLGNRCASLSSYLKKSKNCWYLAVLATEIEAILLRQFVRMQRKAIEILWREIASGKQDSVMWLR